MTSYPSLYNDSPYEEPYRGPVELCDLCGHTMDLDELEEKIHIKGLGWVHIDCANTYGVTHE